MTKKREIYRCSLCGNIVEVVHEGAVLSCCGRPMQLLDEQTKEGSYDKHVPIIEKVDGGFRVRVGSVEHPMAEFHYIQWIEFNTPRCVLRKELFPGDKADVVFRLDKIETCCGTQAKCDETVVSARAYCNLHGLWHS